MTQYASTTLDMTIYALTTLDMTQFVSTPLDMTIYALTTLDMTQFVSTPLDMTFSITSSSFDVSHRAESRWTEKISFDEII